MKYLSHLIAAIIFTAVAAGTISAQLAAAELTESKCRDLQAQLQPNADEPWRSIPWKIELLDAQRTAARAKKPIFIWAMDGHPLGCT
jgi:hypothetical protein